VTWGSGSETCDAYEPGASEMATWHLEHRQFEEAARWVTEGMGLPASVSREDIDLLVAHLPDALEVVDDGDGWLVERRVRS